MKRPPLARGVGALLALCLVLALITSLLACADDDHAPRDRDYLTYEPFYDTQGFVEADGRMSYELDGKRIDRTGIDVSEYQGDIDWDAVAADGVSFAMIRVGYRGTTEGALYPDQAFHDNLYAAHAAGLECGAYFFSQATSVEEALEEAAFSLEMLDGAPLEYPVAFDFEWESGTRTHGLGFDETTQMAKAFCDAIEAGGYQATIYGNGYDLMRFDVGMLADYPVWVAEYASYPSYEHRFALWQYTGSGTVAGISSNVDMNLDLSEALQEREALP